MPSTYFEGGKKKDKPPRGGAHDIRSLAVIAHVDHGKTTLTDSLLLKAGRLHKDRVGDQEKGRSLDTLKDERERGITIKSAAITLEFAVRETVLNNGQYSNVIVTEATKDHLLEVYLGGLPRDFTADRLMTFLVDHGVNVSESCIKLNSRRSYARVTVQDRFVPSVLELDGSDVEKSRLRVQLPGDAPMSHLKEICQANDIQMPSMSVTEKALQDTFKFTATARWAAMGDVIIQAPDLHDTKKEARAAVAQECLSFFQLQMNDHYHGISEEQTRIDDSLDASTSDAERDEASVSTARDSDSHSSDDILVPIVLNLIDSPGHVEFNAEVTAALRVSDGALVVVDTVEGMAVQTQEVLIQALREGVKPVLMLNKVDRLFIDKQYGAVEVYDRMQRVTADINNFIATHQLKEFPDQRVSFEEGSVCFGSGYFGWSCSIQTFIKKNESPDEHQRLCKFLSKRENCIKYIIRPILRMHRLCGVIPFKKDIGDVDRITQVNSFLADRIAGWTCRRLLGPYDDASTVEPHKLLRKAMMAWLPAADALVDMIAAHVPSPVVAQRMRAPLLYSGDLSDAPGQGIYNCDRLGPAVVYISKMAPSGNKNKRLTAFGRVFSGTIRVGDTLRALRTDGSETKAKISQLKLYGIGGRMIPIPQAEAGQLVALEGIDEALQKAGTLTDSPDGWPIRHMHFAVTPVLQHSVKPKVKKNLTKMVAEFHQVTNADATALFFKDHETQEYILAGAGELHIEVLISTFMQNSGIEVELSEPIIAYRESVQTTSMEAALAKSENKHNRVWIKASPLSVALVEAICTGELTCHDTRALAEALVSRFGWTRSEAERVWAVGPEPLSHGEDTSDVTCLLVDSTFGLQIPDDARSNIISAFKQVVQHGVLVNAPMRGVRFDLIDAKFHKDSVHRRPNSVVPAASRAMRGAFMLADPILMEPLYKVDVTGGRGTLNKAYEILGQRGGVIIDTTSTATSESIQASVPVRRAFGLAGELRLSTHGHAHTACLFSGMCAVPASAHSDVIEEARMRRDLGTSLPVAADFLDKL